MIPMGNMPPFGKLVLAIGQLYHGGYFCGRIIDNGVEYNLFVSPKATGNTTLLAWGPISAGPVSTKNLTNGFQATADLYAADGGSGSTHPAAVFCNDLTIGGYTDWYLPARDEIEIAFRALKPLTDNNVTTEREKSAIAYTSNGNQDDVAGDTHGRDRSVGSGILGTAYTAGAPAQTSVVAFQTGQAEAFTTTHVSAEDYYMSSTEFSDGAAWCQVFGLGGTAVTGYQVSFAKNATNLSVRAFRRERA